MIKTNSEIRKEARQSINFKVILTYLALNTLILLVTFTPYVLTLGTGILGIATFDLTLIGILPIIVLLGILLIFIALPYLNLYQLHIGINITRGKSIKFKDNSIAFKKVFPYWGLIIAISIICIPISLISTTFTTGSIFIFKSAFISATLYVATEILYFCVSILTSFVLFVLADDKYCGIWGTLKRGYHLIKEDLPRIMGMYISFIPWFILGIFTFGIAFIWITPYTSISLIGLYNELVNKLDSTKDTENYDKSDEYDIEDMI